MIFAACGQSPVQVRPAGDAWSHFEGRALSFDHPPGWKERPQQFRSGSFSSPLALFSTRKPNQDLCYRRSVPNGTEEGCDGRRLGNLTPGDVVLIVSSFGMPNATLPAGEPLVVDGRTASVTNDDVAGCTTSLGGDAEVTLTIPQPAVHNFLVLNACALKVPDLYQTMRRVAASIRIVPGPSPH
jgi:hypothetical protein